MTAIFRSSSVKNMLDKKNALTSAKSKALSLNKETEQEEQDEPEDFAESLFRINTDFKAYKGVVAGP